MSKSTTRSSARIAAAEHRGADVYMPSMPSDAGVVGRTVTRLFRRRGWVPADELLN